MNFLFTHDGTSINALTVISSVELVRPAYLEVLPLVLLPAVAVGLLPYFLNGGFLGVVGDTAHVEAVLNVLQVFAFTVERVGYTVLELHRRGTLGVVGHRSRAAREVLVAVTGPQELWRHLILADQLVG